MTVCRVSINLLQGSFPFKLEKLQLNWSNISFGI